MKQKLSRRDFLKIATAAGLTLAGGAQVLRAPQEATEAQSGSMQYIPYAARKPNTPTPLPNIGPRVIHVRSAAAVNWQGQTRYWERVNQTVVDNMVATGLRELTNQSDLAAAWNVLLPGFTTQKKFAIKINCNTVSRIDDVDTDIESVAQPIISLVRTLIQHKQVPPQNIWIYDAVRGIPNRIFQPIADAFPDIGFFDMYFRAPATFNANNNNIGLVSFTPQPGAPSHPNVYITDVVTNADYLINVPILKSHSAPSLPGVTLGFKHHFGSINLPRPLHPYIGITDTQGRNYYNGAYSVLVDIFKHLHIYTKSILTMADGLFGYKNETRGPTTWRTFQNSVPKSLLFARDPVAIDCVMTDLIDAEIDLPQSARDYLRLAEQAGLGRFDQGNPWATSNQYGILNYRRIEL